MISTLRLLIVTTVFSGAIALQPAMAADQSTSAAASAKPDAESTQHSTEKTIDTIKLYSIEKKDEAVTKGKEALDDVDARMDKLGQRIKEKKSEWSEKIAKKKEEELADLKKTRQEVAARYEKLKEASKKTWETAKNAFIRSYHRLTHKLDKVNSDTLASKDADVPQNPIPPARLPN
jgi:DNA repair exonuclease SbcCD ATPase subunit